MDPQARRSNLAIAAAIVVAGLMISASLYIVFGETQRTVTSTYTFSTTTTLTLYTNGTSPQPCTTQVWPISSTAPADQNAPVLLMSPSTTGVVCVTYQSAWEGDPATFNRTESTWAPFIVNGTSRFSPFVVNTFQGCTAPVGGSSCQQIIYHSFNVEAVPASVTSLGTIDYITVVYSITAPANSTGFYDNSAPWIGCGAMPLAVGYQASQVNASDFTPQPLAECPAMPFNPVAEYVSGMNVTYVNFLS